MTIPLEIPDEIAALSGCNEEEVARAILEAFATHRYRRGDFSIESVSLSLCHDSRSQTEKFLSERGL
jgi:hypothetical protein